jgi:DNA-directed RNA polymerase subunit M/transcription elongation factor TFIIS
MLPSSGDDNRLQYVCRTCQHSEYADDVRVYYHNVEEALDEQTDIQPENLIADPTLPRARVRCPSCSGTEAVWFQTVAQEAEKMRFGKMRSFSFRVCLACLQLDLCVHRVQGPLARRGPLLKL